MFVKFVNPLEMYNCDGLTLGNVYNVIQVSPKDCNALLIKNDSNIQHYYHKDLFIDATFDEPGFTSFISEGEKEKLSTHNSDQILEMTNAVDNFDKVLLKINDTEPLRLALEIAKKYTDIDILNIFINKMNKKVFPVKYLIESKDELILFSGKRYKLATDPSSVRIVHKDDLFLIGKIIYLEFDTYNEALGYKKTSK